MCDCPVCGSKYQFGPHIYNGHVLQGWDICVCSICYEGNWDGWTPYYEPKLLAILKEKNIEPPARNAKGFFPRDFRPQKA